jgi:hypothetical protein
MISKNQLNEKGEWEQKYVTIKSKKTVTEDGIETFYIGKWCIRK